MFICGIFAEVTVLSLSLFVCTNLGSVYSSGEFL